MTNNIANKRRSMGPGALVAAAFIGPGTVTACTLAGVNFGYALIWVLIFSIVSTMILQEMSARLGIVTKQGLGDALRVQLADSVWRWPLFALLLVALYIGNAAYEAGNIAGAALGIQALAGEGDTVYQTAVTAIGITAMAALWLGSYKRLEKLLIGLVLMMTVSFVITAIIVRPDLSALVMGAVTPTIPDGSMMTVIALIGTTVVPYNLFLHASAAKEHWQGGAADIASARRDTRISIGLGGLVMIAIVSTAAATLFGTGQTVSGAGELAKQLEPLFGVYAVYFIGLGFFGAGLTSAITAPLATAFALSEVLGIKGGVASLKFKLISSSVVLVGMTLALTGVKPLEIILTAQFANGLLLPIIACFLLVMMNRKAVLGDHVNHLRANIFGGIVVLITFGLGLRSILSATGLL